MNAVLFLDHININLLKFIYKGKNLCVKIFFEKIFNDLKKNKIFVENS